MTSNIPLEKYGKILSGEDKDWYIFVHYEPEEEAYYILSFRTLEDLNREVFDTWIENYEDLEEFFEFSNWQVKWLDLDMPSPYN